jgi:hypothetical protein
MQTSTVILCAVAIVVGLGSIYLYAYLKEKKALQEPRVDPGQAAALPLKLQAYERLVLLADRIALPNLVTRSNQGGLSAKEMQALLTQTIRQEFDHNITQQIYVSPEAWEAVRNLKEQNLLIINQVSSYLPENATGTDLNKSLMELLVENPKASLHLIVLEALSFEAKKIMS